MKKRDFEFTALGDNVLSYGERAVKAAERKYEKMKREKKIRPFDFVPPLKVIIADVSNVVTWVVVDQTNKMVTANNGKIFSGKLAHNATDKKAWYTQK